MRAQSLQDDILLNSAQLEHVLFKKKKLILNVQHGNLMHNIITIFNLRTKFFYYLGKTKWVQMVHL